ncbi:hypothetical protein CAPTEDRAFT_209466 [Capitella teleta]|uniref:Uncharacterized protein n=1 Tax=Capitella teleta TaxID=283909 RepID=R7UMZ2_CAPTE|nr:hypothetical protein CAPTEDRAFT_209466 [Capitella teleta]|eukprot:ELU07463.1 hypothetical protein CAPTEDRAFT_209466 [Capitella teleta]
MDTRRFSDFRLPTKKPPALRRKAESLNQLQLSQRVQKALDKNDYRTFNNRLQTKSTPPPSRSASCKQRVQESDGAFFESFTALAWKQENRRRRIVSEDEAEVERSPPLESRGVSRPRHSALTQDEGASIRNALDLRRSSFDDRRISVIMRS